MAIDPRTNQQLHSRLPIGNDEEILGVFKHHWFVYATIWFVGFLAVLAIMIASVLLTNPSSGAENSYRSSVLAGGMLVSVLVGLGTIIPIWLKSQEQLVVTDEALLQILQPSIFGSKVSQLSLQHVADVSVKKDLFGTILGYGAVTVETPGEQANYIFHAIPNADVAAKTIIEAHENFSAALESGRLPTTLNRPSKQEHSVQVDSTEYQRFLDFQQAQAQAREQVEIELAKQRQNQQDV